jgi:hypothetical protein
MSDNELKKCEAAFSKGYVSCLTFDPCAFASASGEGLSADSLELLYQSQDGRILAMEHANAGLLISEVPKC